MPLFRQCRVLLVLIWGVSFLAIFIALEGTPREFYGDGIIRWTVRHSLLFWFAAMVLLLRGRLSEARCCWTLACLSYFIHVAMAFEYAHHWSHQEAFIHVKSVSGYGEGIFVSYFFSFLWLTETIWWNASATTYLNRPNWLTRLVQGFMLFVIFNAVVIFESGPTRWIGAAGFVLLLVLWRVGGRSAFVGTSFERLPTRHSSIKTVKNLSSR
jgi:hypothetical protein